jgi:alpha-ketoglutarate-dependent taurine dioxygenase
MRTMKAVQACFRHSVAARDGQSRLMSHTQRCRPLVADAGRPNGQRVLVTVADVLLDEKEKQQRKKKPVVQLADMLASKSQNGQRKDVKNLPHDPEHLRFRVKSIVDMTENEVTHFAQMMNIYGAAVLSPEIDTEDGLAAYRMLDRLLGEAVPHDKMDERGIVEINPAKATSINTANPKKEHLPHTDDAYTERPSRFITLQCRIAAPSGGGESVLISGMDLLASLNSEEVRSLMKPGMVTMGRVNAADGAWLKTSSIPMFWVDRESGFLQLRWRCNDGCVADVHEKAESAYERMDAVARKDIHQLKIQLRPKDLLIVDNRANAHGRNEFDAAEERVMWRRNYYGDGELDGKMSVGMCATQTSLFEGCSSIFDPGSTSMSDPMWGEEAPGKSS